MTALAALGSMRLVVLPVVLALSVAACGEDAPGKEDVPIAVKDYDQSCTTDADCVPVDTTVCIDPNACGSCADGAVNRRAEPNVRAAVADARSRCAKLDRCENAGACRSRSSVCSNGTCALAP